MKLQFKQFQLTAEVRWPSWVEPSAYSAVSAAGLYHLHDVGADPLVAVAGLAAGAAAVQLAKHKARRS